MAARYTAINKDDSTREKLANLVPAEMIALYTALNGIARGSPELAGVEKILILWGGGSYSLRLLWKIDI